MYEEESELDDIRQGLHPTERFLCSVLPVGAVHDREERTLRGVLL